MKTTAGRLFVALGALSGAASVALGAAGAHMLGGLPEVTANLFRTALQYQQFHALGIILAGLVAERSDNVWQLGWVSTAGALMVAGTLLFSGNLYLRVLADFHALHAVTPLGGGAFILGWLALAVGALKR